ncbi:MAG: hypothetical protein E7559_09095 [Ruminococcaceae bacterium]|nr:hypothetical protein [Oscillospiraceae bacterium]
MKLYNLRKEFPAMPESIRSMVGQEVERQMKIFDAKQTRERKGKAFWLKAAAVAAAAALVVGASAFTVRMLNLHTEKQGDYGFAAVAVAETEIPEALPSLKVQPGWLPEGLTLIDEGWKYSNPETPWQGGLSVELVAMDSEISIENLPLIERYVLSADELTIAGRDAAAVQVQDTDDSRLGFDKRLYIALPEYWQVMIVYAGEDITMEDAISFAENMTIIDTGATRSNMRTLSSLTEEVRVLDEQLPTEYTATAEQLANTHSIGESFSIYEAHREGYEGISVKVTDVQYLDDYSLLDPQYIDREMAAAVDENGKLVKNRVSFVDTGDGVNTLNEILYTTEIEQKLAYVTVEVTNSRETDCRDLLYFAEFCGIEPYADGFRACDSYTDRAMLDADDRTDTVRYSSIGGFGEMEYYDVHGGERNNNYIPFIGAGETVTIHIAKVLNADETDKTYFTFGCRGGGMYFSPEVLLTGYVDIRA